MAPPLEAWTRVSAGAVAADAKAARRIVPIECKVSNSDVNSFKRLIHEAAGKAAKWLTKFGSVHVVPVAVLSGCFSVANLLEAQEQGLALVWGHDLDRLARTLGA